MAEGVSLYAAVGSGIEENIVNDISISSGSVEHGTPVIEHLRGQLEVHVDQDTYQIVEEGTKQAHASLNMGDSTALMEQGSFINDPLIVAEGTIRRQSCASVKMDDSTSLMEQGSSIDDPPAVVDGTTGSQTCASLDAGDSITLMEQGSSIDDPVIVVEGTTGRQACASMDADNSATLMEQGSASINDPLTEHFTEHVQTVTYQVLEQGTRRARTKLIDSNGYTYNVKTQSPLATYWQCTIRPKLNRCRATVVQRGNVFRQGNHGHNHCAKTGAAAAVKITTIVKQEAVNNPLKPAAAIVNEIQNVMIFGWSKAVCSKKVKLSESDVQYEKEKRKREPQQTWKDKQPWLHNEKELRRQKWILFLCSTLNMWGFLTGNQGFIRATKFQVLLEELGGMPPPSLVKPECLARMANRARQSSRPRDPTDLVFEVEEDHIPTEFLRADIIKQGRRHLIFATKEQMLLLIKAKSWYIDQTFKFCQHPFKQLITISVFIKSDNDAKQVPLVFVLMSGSEKKDYRKVINKILGLLPSAPSVREVTVFFEEALWTVLRRVLPDANIKGCVLHWMQAAWRAIQELQLQDRYNSDKETNLFLRKVMALPFLPQEAIQPMFVRLWVQATTAPLQLFIQYVSTAWIYNTTWPPSTWSVFSTAVRSFKDVERWHPNLDRRLLGKRQMPFYVLISLLHKEASYLASLQVKPLSQKKLKRLIRNKKPSSQIAKFLHYWEEYNTQTKSATQLLKACAEVNGLVSV